MVNAYRFLIRVSSFLGKEIAEVLRQPRLILTLVFGPFLILFVFGIGYKNEQRKVRALFVADPNSPLVQQIQLQAPSISQQLIYSGLTGNENKARQDLASGQVDLVIARQAMRTKRSRIISRQSSKSITTKLTRPRLDILVIWARSMFKKSTGACWQRLSNKSRLNLSI